MMIFPELFTFVTRPPWLAMASPAARPMPGGPRDHPCRRPDRPMLGMVTEWRNNKDIYTHTTSRIIYNDTIFLMNLMLLRILVLVSSS